MISRTLSLGSTQKDLNSVAMGDLRRVTELMSEVPNDLPHEQVIESLVKKATRVEVIEGDIYGINFVTGQLCFTVVTTVGQLFAARNRFQNIRRRMVRERRR